MTNLSEGCDLWMMYYGMGGWMGMGMLIWVGVIALFVYFLGSISHHLQRIANVLERMWQDGQR